VISRREIKTKLFCVIFFCCDDFLSLVFFVWWALLSPSFWINLRGPSSSSSFPLSRNDTLHERKKKRLHLLPPSPKKAASRGRLPVGPTNKQKKLLFLLRAWAACSAALQKKKTRIRRGYFSCFSSSRLQTPSSATFSSQRRRRRRRKETKAPNNTLSERCAVFSVFGL